MFGNPGDCRVYRNYILPNITGKFTNNCGDTGTYTGALYGSDQRNNPWWSGATNVSRYNSINLDASRVSSVYQNGLSEARVTNFAINYYIKY